MASCDGEEMYDTDQLKAEEEAARLAYLAADARVEELEAAGHRQISSGALTAADAVLKELQERHRRARRALEAHEARTA